VKRTAALLLWLLFAGSASAHALGVEARLKDGRVVVEAFYDDDTPARDARVVVRDEDRTAVAEGRTDGDGRWSFATPPAGR
jgi:hypothetical protein